MRKKNIFKINTALILMILIILSGMLFAEGLVPYNKTYAKTNADGKVRSMQNAGNWSYWLYQDGQSSINPQGQSGGVYPRGTAGVIFQDGIVWGAVLRGVATEDQRIRVGGQTYFIGTLPGTYDGGQSVGIFRIHNNWNTLTLEDVRRDAMEQNSLASLGAVSGAQMQTILDDYANAWANWPVEAGAPYYDVDSSGHYNPVMIAGTSYPDKSKGDYPGIADADQVSFFVVNDASDETAQGMYGSNAMGIEMQATIWSYDMPSAGLGQIIFKKYKLINKSDIHFDSMYVCQWCDPDLGNSGDDFAGCDTVRSVGFAYNDGETDANFDPFNLPPGAAGYDFFQGPLVPGVAGQDINKNGVDDAVDYGVYDLKKTEQGYVNMPMTSFFYFASGSVYGDPDNGDYENGTLQFYNLLNGRPPVSDTTNVPYYIEGSGPFEGDSTIYPLAGDAVNDPAGEFGDVDGTGGNLTSGDRRMGVNTGPFHLAPGDEQEIVVAVLGGMGSTSDPNYTPELSSLNEMLKTDELAQTLYNDLFKSIPKPPLAPKIEVNEFADHIVLDWGSDLDAVAATEVNNERTGYNFEGYNVYQLPTPGSTIDQAARIATFDLNNGIQEIIEFDHVTPAGDTVFVTGKHGGDAGIQRYISIDRDYITGEQLYKGKKYYFAVTAYSYNGAPDIIANYSLESALGPKEVIPQDLTVGTEFHSELGAELTITHTGGSDGLASATVINPELVTGESYEVFFEEFEYFTYRIEAEYDSIVPIPLDTLHIVVYDTLNVPYVDTVYVYDTLFYDSTHADLHSALGWNLVKTSVTPNDTIVTNQFQAATFDERNDQPTVDGVQIKVTGPALDFKDFKVTANANGPLASPADAFPYWQGGPVAVEGHYDDQQSNPDVAWFIHGNGVNDGSYDELMRRTTQYTGGFGEAVMGISFLIPRDYEIRFTAGRGLFAWSTETMEDVPFQIWCTGELADDPSDDYQCIPWILDDNEDGVFNWQDGLDHPASGGTDDPYTEAVYWVEPQDRSEAGYNALLALHEADPVDASHSTLWAYKDDTYGSVPGIIRQVFVNWNGGDVAGGVYNAEMPEEGTIFKIVTNKPNTAADKFAYTTPVGPSYSDAKAKNDVKEVNVFPNPYYALNTEETNRFDAKVTFNHLPENATIRIFNLAGEQVRKLDKASSGQFMDWDLKNEFGLPVGSGIFIVHVKMPDQSAEKVLKLFVIQRAEIIEYF